VVLVAMATGDRDDTLSYRLVEEQPAGTFIGDIFRDSGLSSRAQSTAPIVFVFLSASAHFAIGSSTGLLNTSAVIDRDVLCPGK